MVLVRDVFQAKYGKGDQLVALLREAKNDLPELEGLRVLADLSGDFFTVVTEYEVENLAAWEKRTASLFAREEFAEWFARMEPLVKWGRREFFRVL